MWKKATSKVFLTFATLVIVVTVALSYLLGQYIVRESETYLLDSLALRSRLKASEIRADLERTKNFSNVASASNLYFLSSDEKRFNLPAEFSTALLSPLLPPSGALVTDCYKANGMRALCSFTYLEGAKIWLFDWTERETVRRVLSKQAKEIAVFVLILLLIALGATFLISHFLVQPLLKFSSAAEKISAGNYENLELPIKRKDEVGELALAFNKMTEDLRDREQHLRLSGIKLAHSERLASIGQMGASIAHEVKNPLTAMLGYAKVLESKIENSELKEAAHIIVSEGERCNQILQQMLRFARNDPQENKPYALKEVIQACVLLAKAEAKSRRLQIHTGQLNDSIVVGSAQQIQQVLLNLILNALQASPQGQSVEIRMNETQGRVVVEIEDHGHGIPKDVQTKIFDPFFTTKDKKEGTGLGLSVASEIAREQGGHISFQSEQGSGTIFRLNLPAA